MIASSVESGRTRSAFNESRIPGAVAIVQHAGGCGCVVSANDREEIVFETVFLRCDG